MPKQTFTDKQYRILSKMTLGSLHLLDPIWDYCNMLVSDIAPDISQSIEYINSLDHYFFELYENREFLPMEKTYKGLVEALTIIGKHVDTFNSINKITFYAGNVAEAKKINLQLKDVYIYSVNKFPDTIFYCTKGNKGKLKSYRFSKSDVTDKNEFDKLKSFLKAPHYKNNIEESLPSSVSLMTSIIAQHRSIISDEAMNTIWKNLLKKSIIMLQLAADADSAETSDYTNHVDTYLKTLYTLEGYPTKKIDQDDAMLDLLEKFPTKGISYKRSACLKKHLNDYRKKVYGDVDCTIPSDKQTSAEFVSSHLTSPTQRKTPQKTTWTDYITSFFTPNVKPKKEERQLLEADTHEKIL